MTAGEVRVSTSHQRDFLKHMCCWCGAEVLQGAPSVSGGYIACRQECLDELRATPLRPCKSREDGWHRRLGEWNL